ncbi:MAG TPA: DUF1315 family protein [Aliidiomarina sp.]|nr:DUF1315 family protein [Aliidiomarina sp.]
MQYDDVLRAMTPEIYERMKSAVETGRWPDGQKLTDTQKENAMELVMVYQAKRLDETEHFSVNKQGELITKTKRDMREDLRAQAQRRSDQDIARFKLDDSNKNEQEH